MGLLLRAELPSKKIVLEFGVYKGYSLNYFAKKLPHSIIYGFDSFLGLEQNWYVNTAKRGTLSLSGKPPKKLFDNVELVIGSFKNTIPDFSMKNPQLQIDLLHIDCDTYSATKLVLASFADNLRPGSIVIFDEFFGYPNWQFHESKAFSEYVTEHKVDYKVIGFSNNQIAIK